MGSVVGCFDAPPEYSVPVLIPPVVITSQVDPPTNVVTTPTPGKELTFDVPFRADDGGEAMLAWFVEDIPAKVDPKSLLGPAVSIPPDPRPFEEQKNRSVNFQWPAPSPSGCHTITMILSRSSNFVGGSLYETVDELATARVTWFLQIPEPNGTVGAPCGSTTGSP